VDGGEPEAGAGPEARAGAGAEPEAGAGPKTGAGARAAEDALPAHTRGYPHAFARLALPDLPQWVAWNLGAAADRLDELKHQVKLARPLRGEKLAPAPIEVVQSYVAQARFQDLSPMDRRRAVDEFDDHARRFPAEAAALAGELWAIAREDEALRQHLLGGLGKHLVRAEPFAQDLVAAFDVFAARPPAGTEELCLILDGLRDTTARGGDDASLEAAILRDYLVEALNLA